MSKRLISLGMTRDRRVPHLLSNVGGDKRVGRAGGLRDADVKTKDPVAFDAEPLSSGSSSDEGGGGGISRRADITSTVFRRSEASGSAGPKHAATGQPARNKDPKRRRVSLSHSPSPSGATPLPRRSGRIESANACQSPRADNDAAADRAAPKDHFATRTDAFRKSERRTAGYGSQRASGNATKLTATQGTTADPLTTSFEIKNTKRPRGRSFSSSEASPKPEFKTRGMGNLADSASPSPRKPKNFSAAPICEDSDSDAPKFRPLRASTGRADRALYKSPASRDSSPEQDSAMAMFRMLGADRAKLDSELDPRLPGKASMGPGSDQEGPTSPVGATADEGPVCPMCNEVVEKGLLDSFTKKKHLTVAEQQRFCQHHKLKRARDIWADRGYPIIDWGDLESRISKHHDVLRRILEGGASHYGDEFAVKVKAGKSKTVLKTRYTPTPGYYGIRGLRLMTEVVIRDFSSVLRKRAVQDRLVSARGHTAYIQAVLVPELAVRLIMEDMGVSEPKARSILQESVSIGELLHEDVGDVVVGEGGSDSDSPLSVADDQDVLALEESLRT